MNSASRPTSRIHTASRKNPTSRIRPTIRIAAVALLAAGLTACGNAQVPVKPSAGQSTPSGQSTSAGQQPSAGTGSTTAQTSSRSTSAPSATSSAPSSSATAGVGSPTTPAVAGTGETESKTVDGHEIAGLPKGFPFPEDAKVDLVVAGSMVQLTAPEGAKIAGFYRTELPKAGLPIDFDSGGDAPVLLFENADWSGQVSVNTDTGALITWGPTTGESSGANPSASGSASSGGETPGGGVTPTGLGLGNADFFLEFPTGTELANVQDSETGGSFTFASPDPATVLTFYRDFVARSSKVTKDSDETSGGATTMKWHTVEANVVLVVSASEARMTVTAP